MAGKVLIMEDDAAVMKICKRALEKNGYQVIATVDPVEATHELKNDKMDLVVADLLMRYGGGASLLKVMSLLEDPPKTPVLVITGATDEEIEKKLKGYRINGLLKKPFVPDQFLAEVKKILGSV